MAASPCSSQQAANRQQVAALPAALYSHKQPKQPIADRQQYCCLRTVAHPDFAPDNQ